VFAFAADDPTFAVTGPVGQLGHFMRCKAAISPQYLDVDPTSKTCCTDGAAGDEHHVPGCARSLYAEIHSVDSSLRGGPGCRRARHDRLCVCVFRIAYPERFLRISSRDGWARSDPRRPDRRIVAGLAPYYVGQMEHVQHIAAVLGARAALFRDEGSDRGARSDVIWLTLWLIPYLWAIL